MCHLVLILPVLGLGVFLIWPFSTALPVYALILLISGLIYYAMIKAMQQPIRTGSEGLRGQSAEVIDMQNHEGHVRIHGEIWQATSSDSFRKGDTATVQAVQGLTLNIARLSEMQRQQLLHSHCAH